MLIRKTADIYPADEKWTVAVVISAPTPPPLRQWRAEAYHLFDRAEVSIPDMLEVWFAI